MTTHKDKDAELARELRTEASRPEQANAALLLAAAARLEAAGDGEAIVDQWLIDHPGTAMGITPGARSELIRRICLAALSHTPDPEEIARSRDDLINEVAEACIAGCGYSCREKVLKLKEIKRS